MKIEVLLQSPLFEGFDEDELAKLLFGRNNKPRKYAAGDMIHYQGDEVEGLHLLVEGSIVTTMTGEGGKSFVVETLTAPSLFAPAFMFATDNHFPVSVEAKTDCEVMVVERQRLMKLMAEYPHLMFNVMRDISDRCAFLTRRLREFATTNLKQRILLYIRQHGEIKNQSEVARVLGVARPSLSRALAELERDGLL